MTRNKATVFVNGIFNPKNDDVWSEIEGMLQEVFGCDAMHVHNPTLAVEMTEERAMDALKKNARLAFGGALLMAGALALDAYLEADYTTKMIVTSMDHIKSTLEERADKVALKMETEMLEFCAENKEVDTIHICAHSHGGWCTKRFIENGHLENIATQHNVKFQIFILGCPVLVQPLEPHVTHIIQLHNQQDLVSLHYEPKDAAGGCPHVISANSEAYHSCKKYLIWLKEVHTGSTSEAKRRSSKRIVDVD